MKDARRTKAELLVELEALRRRVAELEGREPAPRGAPALLEGDRMFRALAESTTAHISVVEGDRYLYANQAFLDYFGVDLEDLKLTTPEDLMQGLISPQMVKEVAPVAEAAIARGESHFDFEMQYLDGLWLQTHVTILHLGGPPIFMLLGFDITAHKRAQAALADSEKRFRALAESTTAQILIATEERFLYANKAALDHYGLGWEELSRTPPSELLLGPDDVLAECAGWADEQAAQGGGRFRTEHSEVDAAGVERWYETHIARLEIDGARAWIATSLDITELKRAQNEMYRADKMAALGQVVAGVAHELNNPNNFITLNLPVLRRYLDAIAPLLERGWAEQVGLRVLGMDREAFLEDLRKLIDNMELGSRRITSIVSDLRSYVRSDEEERRAAPIGQVVERAMTLVGKQVRKLVRRLDVEVAEGLPEVVMNPGRIEQVLINLLLNAGQAADKEDSFVRLTARPARALPGWVEIAVLDNGVGIAPDQRERIFEPFYTSKGRDQGTGLGLSISQRIVEEHGGKLGVESTPGQGACFTVLLPPAP